MKRRLWLELVAGVMIASAFFYWTYLRPEGQPKTSAADSPEITERARHLRPKLLIIGIDGLAWAPLLQFANEGKLPNFSALIGSHPRGVLKAAPPLVGPAAWTTLATGVPPEVHGLTDVAAKVPFQYREERLGSDNRRAPALWEMAGRFGRKVALINWPGADREEFKDGVFIAENTDPDRPGPDQVRPAEWAAVMASAPRPSYPELEQAVLRCRDPRLVRAYQIDAGIYAATELILQKESPDLVMVQFGSLSAVTHGFWQYRWPLGLEHAFLPSDQEVARYRDAVENHLRLLDRLVGGLLTAAPGYTVVVVSAYGQSASYPPGNIRLEINRLLERMGWLEFDSPACDRIIEAMDRRKEIELPWPPAEAALELCQSLAEESADWLARGEELMAAPAVEAFISVHYPLKDPADDQETELRLTLMTNLARSLLPGRQRQDIVWSKTRAWNTRDFRQERRGIFLNVIDREPEGLVPQDDYSSRRRRLVRELKSLRTESGRRLFREVIANPDKDLFPFDSPDPPDLFVRVDPEALVEQYLFREAGDMSPIPLAALRWSYGDISADNSPEGVVIVAGGDFAREDLDALDFTPTLLNFMGLPVGANLPGKVAAKLLPAPDPVFIRDWAEPMGNSK